MMKIGSRTLRVLVGFAFLGAIAVAGSASAATSPRSVVRNLDDQLLATMKHSKKLGFEGRYRKLAPVIDQSFDLHRIARLALGSDWSKLSGTQQKAYATMFRKDTIATYASRFDGYDGQSIKIKGVQQAPAGRKQVNTVIVSDGKSTPINYLLTNESGQWRIVNVVAKGVSDLALKHGQYHGAIQQNGPDGFIRQFKHQLTKYPTIPEVADTSAAGAAKSRPSKASDASSDSSAG